jgi:hypothetical protein
MAFVVSGAIISKVGDGAEQTSPGHPHGTVFHFTLPVPR